MKRVYQILDAEGAPQGGHVFVAPSEATLELQLQAAPLPEGWTRVEVQAEEEIITPVAALEIATTERASEGLDS